MADSTSSSAENHAPLLSILAPSLDNTVTALLQELRPHGHWEGELSSSPLSTATTVMALRAVRATALAKVHYSSHPIMEWDRQITSGMAWLVATQNPDGGWGDTTRSQSNISTTALVWAALAGCESSDDSSYRECEKRCENWLESAAGSLEPKSLAKAIGDRYGKDRTFSVPILTTLALHGRLGDSDAAWDLIPQLPFELAACPPTWFAALRLPVVSYALPALIAMGQVRHARRPTRNPIARFVRNLARNRTLRVLQSIQPTSGGYLEATPLTSFVVISLAGAGLADHPAVQLGTEFLLRSFREAGSWPIDTNLATWVTTLSIQALATANKLSLLPLPKREALAHWLLGQQYREVHRYTNAPPGGWAWTDLTGGVPDADDTPGALLALHHLQTTAGKSPDDGSMAESAAAGIEWLLNLQNRDGGIPTFCRGWGTLPFDRSSCDITAHTLRALSTWRDKLPPALHPRLDRAVEQGIAYLLKQQQPDGSWAPLWFGNQFAADETNRTYGTSRVLIALLTIPRPTAAPQLHQGPTWPDVDAAAKWLAGTQNEDGGFGSGPSTPSSIEETALALEALALYYGQPSLRSRTEESEVVSLFTRALHWWNESTRQGSHFPANPIGFYFAKLWYYERLYPIVYSLSALGRLDALFSKQG